jgi:hypothetical protein
MRAAQRILAAMAILIAAAAAGCTEAKDHAQQCSGRALERPMLVLESDRSSASALARIGTDGCLTETADITLGADPSIAYSRERPFVVARDRGVIHEIDPGAGTITAVFVAYTEGEEPSNPHDVAVDGEGRLWIARYNMSSVAIVEPDGSWGGSVDLSALGGADGIPDMEAITIVGDKAFVALERLDADHKAEGPGVIAAISTAPPREVVGSIELTGRNPFGRMTPAPWDASGATVAAAAPGYINAISDTDTNGVEIISLDLMTSELVISEADLGGDPMEVILAGPSEGYAIVAGPVPDVNPTSIVAFDPKTRTVTRTLAGPAGGFVHAGLALNGPYLVVGDHTFGAPAIRFFDRTTGEEAFSMTPSLLPPVALLTLEP